MKSLAIRESLEHHFRKFDEFYVFAWLMIFFPCRDAASMCGSLSVIRPSEIQLERFRDSSSITYIGESVERKEPVGKRTLSALIVFFKSVADLPPPSREHFLSGQFVARSSRNITVQLSAVKAKSGERVTLRFVEGNERGRP
jgi:hypothetical protein